MVFLILYNITAIAIAYIFCQIIQMQIYQAFEDPL